MVIQTKVSRALVLENKTAEDVSQAMIKSGWQKEPFYIFEMDQAYERIEHFREMMPRIKIFYAMKANDSEMMLKLVASLGLGFDCASPGELHKILKINVSPLSIIFAVPAKTPEWMLYARQCGIRYTTFDSSCELNKIKQYWPEARLLIRIRVDGNSVYNLGKKFGCDFETEAIDLLEEAAALNIMVAGVAYHVGSGCSSADSYVLGLQQAKLLFEHEAKAGRKMNIVDIGGGFMGDRSDRIDEVSKLINMTVEELFPDPNIQIIAEPGRYLCESSYTLYCNMLDKRFHLIRHDRIGKGGGGVAIYLRSHIAYTELNKSPTPYNQSSEHLFIEVPRGDANVNMLYINDGVHGTMRYNESWHTVKRYEGNVKSKYEYLEPAILWGPSCDSTDRVMENVEIMLPRCTTNDWLVFSKWGAYTLTNSSNFSSLEGSRTRTVVSEELCNKIKNSKAFDQDDFIKQDISEPLPSSLPPVVVQTRLLDSNCTLNI